MANYTDQNAADDALLALRTVHGFESLDLNMQSSLKMAVARAILEGRAKQAAIAKDEQQVRQLRTQKSRL